MRILVVGGLLFSIISSQAHAANIYVSVTAPDQVGKSFAYSLREGIASSRQHKLVNLETEAAFMLRVVTLNPQDREGLSTIYSATLTMSNFNKDNPLDYFLTSWVGQCGSSRTTECARNVIAGVDDEITPIVEALAKRLRK